MAISKLANVATRGAVKSIATSTDVSQDNIIFGLILLAFVIYITVKGELPTYLGFFTPQAGLGPKPQTVTATSAGTSSTPTSAVTTTPSSVTQNPNSSTTVNLPGVQFNPSAYLPSWTPSWIQQALTGWNIFSGSVTSPSGSVGGGTLSPGTIYNPGTEGMPF